MTTLPQVDTEYTSVRFPHLRFRVAESGPDGVVLILDDAGVTSRLKVPVTEWPMMATQSRFERV